MPSEDAQRRLEHVFPGESELARLMRQLDWSGAPLGPVRTWPQALKTCLQILLSSRQPMWLAWGEQLTYFYNDPYKSIIGGKHPWALGRPLAEVWSEIWDDIESRIHTTLEGNQGKHDEALLLIMERNGYPEETYHTFSYSPVADDRGGVGGIFCANSDDTQQVIGERQLALLRELAAGTAGVRTVDDAIRRSARALETDARDLPFALIYLAEPDAQGVVLAGTVNIGAGRPAAPQRLALDAAAATEPWPAAEVLRRGEVRLVSGLDRRFPELPAGVWDRAPSQAAVLPIAASGESGRAGILVAGLSPYRQFNASYRDFLNLVSRQIAAAVTSARAYEGERARTKALAKENERLYEEQRERTAVQVELNRALRELADARDQALAEAQTARQHLHDVFMQAPAIVGVLRGPDHVVELAKAPLLQAVGAERDVIGKPVRDVVPEIARQGFIDLLDNVYTTDTPFIGNEMPAYFDRPGQSTPEEILFNFVYQPLHEPDGTVGGIFVLGIDVSTQVRARQAAEKANRRSAELVEAIRHSEALLEAELTDTRLLQRVSAQLISGEKIEDFYATIVDAAVAIMHADAGCMQLLMPEDGHQGELKLLAHRGFSQEAAQFWQWVNSDSSTCCAISLRERQRFVVPDIVECVQMAGSKDQVVSLRAGIRAAQATPLFSRGGEVVGIISTQWRQPHQPSERDLLLLDILARQAADLLERTQHEDDLRGRIRQAELAAEVGVALATGGALPEQLQTCAEAVLRHFDAAFVRIWTLNEAEQVLELRASAGLYTHLNGEHSRMPVGAYKIGRIAAERTPYLTNDVIHDPRISNPEWAQREGMEAFAGCPLLFGTRLVGVLGLFARHPLSKRVLAAMESIAGTIAAGVDRAAREAERAWLLQQIQESLQTRDAFLASAAHDLKTPLTTVKGMSQLLRRQFARAGSLTEPLAEGLATIESAATQMGGQIDELLDLTRVQMGESLQLNLEPTDLVELVGRVAEEQQQAHERHTIRIEAAEPVITGQWDAVRLGRVLENLLSNAIKYSPEGGEVLVRLAQEADAAADVAVVSIEDHGIGIPAVDLARVFERFQRAGNVGHIAGAGIGLASVRHLVEQHGGSISVESREGEGSTFTVRLPVSLAIKE